MMKKWLKKINMWAWKIRIFLIQLYQKTLSPDKGIFSFWLKGKICTHHPHCSEYAIQSLRHYGFFPWFFYGLERISQCVPRYEKTYDPHRYRVIFFSSAPIWVEFMKKLSEDPRFNLIAVVTVEDKPVGRGMHIQENIIKSEAIQLWIRQIKTPSKIHPEKSEEGKEFADWLQSEQPDFIVVIAYGKILPQHILDIPLIDCINVHGSILPEYRGASPLQSVFLDGKKETWITIMRMVGECDAGEMIKVWKFPLPWSWTVKDLIAHIVKGWPQILVDALREYGKGRLKALPQDPVQATFCKKIIKEDGLIDVSSTPLYEVYHKYQAYLLWPKVAFMWWEKRIAIEELHVEENSLSLGDPMFDMKILNSAINYLKVKPEGKKSMSWESFIAWYVR